MIKALGQNGLNFIANKFKELKALVDKKANVEDIVASKMVEKYELDKNFWDARHTDQQLRTVLNRDKLTLVHFKQDDEFVNRILDAGFESALFYKGTPLSYCFVSRQPWSTFVEDVKNDTLPSDRVVVRSNVLSKYNNVIQQQLKDIDSKIEQSEPIPLDKLQSFYDGNSETV